MKDLIWEFEEEEKVKQEPIIGYYSNGEKKYEEWYLNGKLHRENGPAIQSWYENGQKAYEEWYINGEYHREDGPAFRYWNINGKERVKFWYLNGKRIK